MPGLSRIFHSNKTVLVALDTKMNRIDVNVIVIFRKVFYYGPISQRENSCIDEYFMISHRQGNLKIGV